jgi:DNA-binding response OmpR family regulator
MAHIAVIEDEPNVAKAFEKVLVADQHVVTIFHDRGRAERGLRESAFDAVILDLRLGTDALAGIGIISTIGAKKKPPPVLVISGEPPGVNRPQCLVLGVWDYLQKPVEEPTLRFKVTELLEESNPRSQGIYSVGALTYDLHKPCAVVWKREEVGLALTAYRILLELVTNNGTVVPHRQLYAVFAGQVTNDNDKLRNNLRAHVKTLRDTFRDIDPEFAALRTVPGGYCWNE